VAEREPERPEPVEFDIQGLLRRCSLSRQ
jgi:hypothetical protein